MVRNRYPYHGWVDAVRFCTTVEVSMGTFWAPATAAAAAAAEDDAQQEMAMALSWVMRRVVSRAVSAGSPLLS